MKKIILCVFLSVPFLSNAQGNIHHHNLQFFRYQFSLCLHNNYTLKLEAEERSFLGFRRQSQYIIRAGGEKEIYKNLTLGGSFTYSNVSNPQDPDASYTSISSEYRPSLYLTFKNQLSKKWAWQQRFQQDIRFFEEPKNCYTYSNMRSRYLMEIDYSINHNFSAKLSDELIFNTQNNKPVCAFEQNRISLAVHTQFNKSWASEISYIKWFQQFSSGNEYYDKNILRLAILHKIVI